MAQESDFRKYVAQTSPEPLSLSPSRSEGIYIYGEDGRRYIDVISGISVSNLGHGQPAIREAIKAQTDQYIHSMVYGEHIQSPQVQFAKRLVQHLPNGMEQVYFVNSGSEAIEGAMKLAKRVTGRHRMVALRGGYHGNTHAALSLMDNPYYSDAYRPFVPGVRFIEPGDFDEIDVIDSSTAGVIMETIQGAMGYRVPDPAYIQAIRRRCAEVGALLILDEIQAGLGRSGKLWGFEHMGIIPDILCLAKALGGGLPLGAFISSRDHMMKLTHDPVLGHITTFGGHPVCCAAGLAAFNLLLKGRFWETAEEKGQLFRKYLQHPKISHISGIGLMMAVNLYQGDLVFPLINKCLDLGLLTDGFLHNLSAIRLAPPLIISEEEIKASCEIILKAVSIVSAGVP
jgi:acetylornithine/succinyldiaminopimelate/putrescine aminotransferase